MRLVSRAARLVCAAALCLAFATVGAALLPASEAAADELVSISLKDASLLRVIEVLVYERGLNIVAPPGLDRKVTVRLHDVPWRQALGAILREHGYGFEEDGPIVRVDTLERLAGKPRIVELPVRHLQRDEAESVSRSALSSGASVQVVETPAAPGRARSLTLVVEADRTDERRLRSLLARLDRPVRRGDGLTIQPDGRGTYLVRALDAPVGPALDAFARALDLNVTWDDPPRGRATVDLAGVSARAALSALLRPLGYSFEISRNMVRIGLKPDFESQVETRVFRLVYVNALHVKTVVQPMLSKEGKVEVFGELPPKSKEELAAAAAQAATAAAAPGLAPRQLGRGRQPSTELTRPQPPSDKVVVTDAPGVLARVDELIRELDRPPQQVDIETQLLEVSLTRETQLGIRWNVEAMANGAAGNKIKFPLDDAEVRAAGVAPNFTLGVLSATNFAAMLKALSRRNNLRVLSSPRISTLSSEPARILIGQRFPITVQSLSQQVAFTTVTLDYFEDIGIVLTVTPRVTAENTVHLSIKPQVSTIASLVDNRFPVIDTREAESQLVVGSGNTAIIGGLVQDRIEKDEEGIPGLAHLGAVGRLFGLHRRSKRRTELLVCVTPRILDTPRGQAAPKKFAGR